LRSRVTVFRKAWLSSIIQTSTGRLPILFTVFTNCLATFRDC